MEAMTTHMTVKAKNIEVSIDDQTQACFHGLSVNKIPNSPEFSLPVEKVICLHEYIRVYVSRCLTERKCAIAVKEYSFKEDRMKTRFQKEVDGYRFLSENPHENFTAYYGGFYNNEKGFIALELSDMSFFEFLEKNKTTLSISQWNEICFQVLSMNQHFEIVGFVPDGYGFGNMVFSCKDGKIKLIDLESYTLKSETPDMYNERLDFVLDWTGIDLLLLQLEIKCREDGNDFSQVRTYFFDSYHKYYQDPFDVEKSESLACDKKLWHRGVDETTKRAIASCFVKQPKDCEFNSSKIFSQRHLIQNRDTLKHDVNT